MTIILFSCEKYIDMEIPDRGRKLAANCLYNDSGEVTVYLRKSKFILDNTDYDYVSGARIVFFENGIARDTLSEVTPGLYKTNGFIPSQGAIHLINIQKDQEEISASSHIPKAVPFLLTDTIRVQTQYNDYLRFRIQIHDPSDTDNYYLIRFKIAPEENFPEPLEYLYLYFYTDEPFIENYSDEFGIFSDILFKGQSQIMSFDLELSHFSNDTNKLYIDLLSVSEDMYMYLLTSLTQQNSSNSPFSEPVMVFNNIENGYGIFAGYTIYQDSIIIPKLADDWGWID